MLPIYYLGTFLCSVLGYYSGQKYARSTKTTEDVLIYSLITGVLAMGVFYVLSGFHLQFNIRTLIYAVLFALLVFSGYFITIYTYRCMTIAAGSFIPSGIRLMIIPVIGVIVFGESFTLVSLVQTILVLLMLLTLFLASRKEAQKVNAPTGIKVLLLAAAVVHGVLVSTLYNTFANDPLVCDSNSFFFLTNVFTVLVSIVALLAISRCRPRRIFIGFKAIPLVGYFMIFLSVFSSNIGSLLSVLVLQLGSLVLYTPLSGALGLLAAEVVAVVIAKEKPQILATVLAISSVLVVILF